jgi:hypothetical protein
MTPASLPAGTRCGDEEDGIEEEPLCCCCYKLPLGSCFLLLLLHLLRLLRLGTAARACGSDSGSGSGSERRRRRGGRTGGGAARTALPESALLLCRRVPVLSVVWSSSGQGCCRTDSSPSTIKSLLIPDSWSTDWRDCPRRLTCFLLVCLLSAMCPSGQRSTNCSPSTLRLSLFRCSAVQMPSRLHCEGAAAAVHLVAASDSEPARQSCR